MHEATWDTSANSNKGMPFLCRCRFDRCYWIGAGIGATGRSGPASSPASADVAAWRSVHFELVGKSKVHGLNRFPSDHWGLQVRFELPLAKQQKHADAEANKGEVPNAAAMEEAVSQAHVDQQLN
eukprot:6450990-Amphidinium_carterae.1